MSSDRHTDLLVPSLTVAFDVVAIVAAFLGSYLVRFETGLFDWLGFVHEDMPPIEGYVAAAGFAVVLWVGLFHARRMYASRRAVSLADELFNVTRVVALGMLLTMSAAFLYREYSYSRVVFGLIWMSATVLVFGGRAGVRAIERTLYRRGRHLRQAVLIGSDSMANQLYHRLNHHASYGFEILGYFADVQAPEGLLLSRARYHGPLAAAPDYITTNGVTLAFIAVRPQDHPALFDIIARCEGVNIDFLMVPDVVEVLTSQVKVRELEGIPFLKIKSVPFTMWGRITKRTFDLAVSAALIVALAPLALLIALLIRLDSPGPVLFRQRRVGLDGREFTMYKFRSMRTDAELSDRQAGTGIRNDPRRTRIGKILRSTGFDELPQLLNVLRGEMSLVGPRPERAHVVQEFTDIVPKYLDRHRVKTGLTGWAQVNGLRGDTSIAERIKYDLFYIENWSLGFDVKILLRTLRTAFTLREVGKT